MAWFYLLCAGVTEIIWAIGLKYTKGFTAGWPTVITLGVSLASLWLLSLAVRTLPIGTAYAVWTGIGAVGTAIFGMILFHEPRDAPRLMCIGLIVLGIAGLKLTSRGGAG